MIERRGNLGPAERWISLVSGAGLTLAALARGGLVGRGLTALAGLTLLSRGASGYCGMKAALTGETSVREGMQEEWERLRSGVAVTPVKRIDSMEALYMAEMQELHSAEAQLGSLLDKLPDTVPDASFQRALRSYATEIRTRREDLDRLITRAGANPRQHPDQAMRALLRETHKMAQLGASNLRSAALVASLQRLIHYKIAGYGTVASYAKTLGHIEEASRLADYADRDRAVDQELTSIAKEIASLQAPVPPRAEEAAAAARPH